MLGITIGVEKNNEKCRMGRDLDEKANEAVALSRLPGKRLLMLHEIWTLLQNRNTESRFCVVVNSLIVQDRKL